MHKSSPPFQYFLIAAKSEAQSIKIQTRSTYFKTKSYNWVTVCQLSFFHHVASLCIDWKNYNLNILTDCTWLGLMNDNHRHRNAIIGRAHFFKNVCVTTHRGVCVCDPSRVMRGRHGRPFLFYLEIKLLSKMFKFVEYSWDWRNGSTLCCAYT